MVSDVIKDRTVIHRRIINVQYTLDIITQSWFFSMFLQGFK
jgi:hypothetical protein